jgi:hypothetical protein
MSIVSCATRACEVDAAPNRDQPPALHPARQRASGQAGGRELRRGHDAMLAGRETDYYPVAGVHFVDLAHLPPLRSTFGTHTVRFVDLTRDAIIKSTKRTLGHHPLRGSERPISPPQCRRLTNAGS